MRWVYDRMELAEFIAKKRLSVARAAGEQLHVKAQREQERLVFAGHEIREGR
jgi:hypothetical protein